MRSRACVCVCILRSMLQSHQILVRIGRWHLKLLSWSVWLLIGGNKHFARCKVWELYSFMRHTSIVRNLHTFCSSLVLVPLEKLWLPPEKLTSQRSATGCEDLLIVPQTPPGQQSIQVKALCFFKTFFNHLEMTTEVPFNDTLRPAPPPSYLTLLYIL